MSAVRMVFFLPVERSQVLKAGANIVFTARGGASTYRLVSSCLLMPTPSSHNVLRFFQSSEILSGCFML
jgi:hypothetical protein